jgi:type IV secretion system protein VirB3
MSNQDLNEDTLFLACTRPAMIAGVTMEAMGINVIVTCLVFILAGNIFYVLVGIIFHMILRGLCKYDHNMFRVLVNYLETKGRCRNTKFWGGSSVSPLKVVRRYNEQDFNRG